MKQQLHSLLLITLALLFVALSACSAKVPASAMVSPFPTGTTKSNSASTEIPPVELTEPVILPSTTPDRGSNILAVTSDRDGDFEIYVLRLDGSDPVQMTFNHEWDCCADWSPDGSKITFVSTRDGTWEIYVMNADGSDQTRLTMGRSSNVNPSWSPDGSRIVFASNRDGNLNIYSMEADGTNQKRLTNNGFDNGDPDWSPDGKRIVYTSVDYTDNPAASEEIFIMNADGSEPMQLTHNNVQDLGPAWSPDGSRILYSSTPSQNAQQLNWDIYAMDLDGSEITRLTSKPSAENFPAWSLDGKQIVFTSCNEDQSALTGQTCDLFLMNEDGSIIQRITDFHSNTGGAAWSPLKEYVNDRLPDCTSSWTHLEAGKYAAVMDENGTPNRVRSGPSLADEVIAQVYSGTPLKVLEGPVCADGLVFWNVEHKSIPGGSGWTAEGDGSEYWLEPYTP